MDDRAIARWRLHTLRLSGRPYPSVPAVVDGLLAVQAENHAQASWAVATRASGVTEAEFGRLFDAGVILRTHVMRPTWHYVLPDDIRWLVEVTAPRILPAIAQQQRELDLDDGELDRSAELIVDALSGGVQLNRDALGARLRDAGLPAEGRRLGVMLAYAELHALICSGAMQGKDHSYALVDERAPGARRLERDEALVELVRRYLTGHGPATERDLAYWASLTLTDVRKGLAEVGGQLERLEHDGRTYWAGQAPPDDDTPSPRAHLLQVLDEYHNGCQDSRYVLDADGIVPRGRPIAMGMALVDSQMVGDVRRSLQGDQVRFDVGLFRPVDRAELAALHDAAERYGRFLGLTPTVTTSPR